jgi:hypothetical protein
MDMNVYSLEWLARERLADARARVAREAWARTVPRRPWRVALGLALIGLGHRIVGQPARRREALASETS